MSVRPKKTPKVVEPPQGYEPHDTLEMDRAEIEELVRKSAADAPRELDSAFDLSSPVLDD